MEHQIDTPGAIVTLAGKAALTVGEAAETLGFSENTIFNLIRERKLRSIKVGGSRRIPASAIAELLADAS